MNRSLRHLLVFCAVGALSATVAVGQQQNQPDLAQPRTKSATQGNQDTRQPAAGTVQGQAGTAQGQSGGQAQTRPAAQAQTALRPVQRNVSEADHAVAALLALGNHEEVGLGKLAAQNAENAKTKEFAEMMVKDHEQARDQLLVYAPDALGGAGIQKGQIPANQNQQGQARPQQGQPPVASNSTQPAGAAAAREDGQTAPAMAGRGFNFLEAKRRIGQQCLESAQKELGQKKGREFDACYMGTMVVKHQEMIDTQKALREYASPELQKTIDEQMQTASEHLEHAKRLMQQLEKS